MLVRDIMTTYPSVVCRDDSIVRAARVMRDRRIGMLPVIDDLRSRRLLGVLTDHDVVTRCVAGTHDVDSPVSEYMTTQLLSFVEPDDDVTNVIRLMQRRKLRRIPVVDQSGRLTGIIALADLATRMTPQDPDVLRAIELRVSGGHAAVVP
jgi:CBS domain-containing protein